MQDVLVPCKKCHNKVPASSLKLDLDEKMVICPDCIKNKGIHREIEQEIFHEYEEKKSAETKNAEPSMKAKHKCSSCGYNFSINLETNTPKFCPYCNERVTNF